MKAKMKLHKLLSMLLALVMVVGMIPAMSMTAYADGTLSEFSNVKISDDGVLTWDAVEGAARYSISVATFGGIVYETSYDLKYKCNFYNTSNGTKDIHLVALDAEKNKIAEWYGAYEYVDDRPQLDAPQNIQLNGPIISWDPVPNATYYVVNILGDSNKRHQVTDTFYVYDNLVDGNTYLFYVTACALEYSRNSTETRLTYHKVLYPITVTNGYAEDGYRNKLDKAEQGTDVILFADPVPEGYVFRGWRSSGVETEDPQQTVTGFTMPGNPVTATAVFDIPYTVSVENGVLTSTGKKTGQFFKGETVYITANEAPNGYRLKGWTSNDATVPSGSILNTSFEMPGNDVVVKAEYELRPYTVTFKANGHGTAPGEQIVKNGEKATKPKDLTAAGYTFAGWYKDAACTMPFDFKNTPITEDTTLYAKWLTGEFFTVTFANIKSNLAPEFPPDPPDAQLVEQGGKAARPEPDPTAEGWLFDGWTKKINSELFDFDNETITKDITLYASWAEPYYVNFEANGGTGTMDPVAVIPGDWCPIPECGFTAPEGKQFKGWAFSPDTTEVVGFTSFEVKGGDKTLYAIWEDKSVTPAINSVTVEPATAAVVKGNTQQFTATVDKTGEIAETVTWTVTGANSTNTSISDTGLLTVGIDETAATLIVKATSDADFSKYGAATVTLTNPEYTITVTDGKATVGAGTVITKAEEGTTVTLTANAAPDGQVFDKWIIESDNINEWIGTLTSETLTFTMPAGAVSVKATYKTLSPDEHTVTFNANGHGTAPAAQTVESGKTAAKPANPSEEGYTFCGWYKNQDCSQSQYFDFTTAITEDITLYAKWKENLTSDTYWSGLYTNRSPHGKVNLNGDGISTNTGSHFAAEKELIAYAYPDEGYRFKEWQDEAGDVVSTNNPYTYKLKSETYLYAIFEVGTADPIVTYTVTFDANGHGTAPAAQAVEIFNKASKPADPTADGWTFGGWYTDSDCTENFYFSSKITKNITLYAGWTEAPKQFACGLYNTRSTFGKVSFEKDGSTSNSVRKDFAAGAELTAYAYPDEGYVFKEWQDSLNNTVSKDNPYTFTLNGNVFLYAIFEKDGTAPTEYAITVTGGTATPATAAKGTTVTLNANAAPSGQVFDKWVVESGSITLADASSATTTFKMPAEEVSVRATYKDAPHTHTFDQEIIKDAALKTAADCTHDAVYYKSCSCGAISTTETFTATDTALDHGWPTAGNWSQDTDKHWYECSRCHEKKDEAAHDYGDDDICDTCTYDKSVSHTHNLTLVTESPATCTTPGNKAYYTCDGCDKWFEDASGSVEITDKTSVIISATNHTPSDDWKSDANYHWKVCKVNGCGVMIEDSKEAHTASDWITDTAATATTDGTKHKECNVCHHVLETGTIPATGSGEHTHSYGSDWKSDANKHWHQCECGAKADEAAHTPDREAATETDPIKCTECDYIITAALGHTHSLTKVEAKAPTCTEDGNIEYYTCSGCSKLFADAAGNVEITADQTVDKATGHTYGWVIDKETTATGSVVAPKIIEGDAAKVTRGEKTALSFRSDADFSDFIRVEIDGKTLDTKNYTVKEGSTIVTLNGDYVSTLSVGTHTIGVVSKNGTAIATFTVEAKQTTGDKDNPKTGDDSNMILWIVLLLASGLGVTGTVVYSKRKKYAK